MKASLDRSRPYYSDQVEDTVANVPGWAASGSMLLAGLMWLAFVVSGFLIMLGVIVPTYGNVFIVLVFLVVAVVASSMRGERDGD